MTSIKVSLAPFRSRLSDQDILEVINTKNTSQIYNTKRKFREGSQIESNSSKSLSPSLSLSHTHTYTHMHTHTLSLSLSLLKRNLFCEIIIKYILNVLWLFLKLSLIYSELLGGITYDHEGKIIGRILSNLRTIIIYDL